MAYHKATPVSDFPRRAIDFRNIDSLRYQYTLHPAKKFPTAFANHASITLTRPPRFVDLGSSWCQLSDGGSRMVLSNDTSPSPVTRSWWSLPRMVRRFIPPVNMPLCWSNTSPIKPTGCQRGKSSTQRAFPI